jgi:hypothetical protein
MKFVVDFRSQLVNAIASAKWLAVQQQLLVSAQKIRQPLAGNHRPLGWE